MSMSGLPRMALVCQVARIDVDVLVCLSRESGGKQCERLDPHDEDGHSFGPHTIWHERVGPGWPCHPPSPVNVMTLDRQIHQSVDTPQAFLHCDVMMTDWRSMTGAVAVPLDYSVTCAKCLAALAHREEQMVNADED